MAMLETADIVASLCDTTQGSGGSFGGTATPDGSCAIRERDRSYADMKLVDKESGEECIEDCFVVCDEGNRFNTSIHSLAFLMVVRRKMCRHDIGLGGARVPPVGLDKIRHSAPRSRRPRRQLRAGERGGSSPTNNSIERNGNGGSQNPKEW